MMQSCNTLLLVDDMQINRAILSALFEGDYEILEAEDGAQALTMMRRNRNRIAAVLLDLLMPVKDGYAVLREVSADDTLSRIPVIVITADRTSESEVRVFDLGASDIITKPFESRSVKRRIQNAVELYQHKLHLEDLVEEQAAQIRESNTALIDGLSSVIEHRSLESGQHIRRIRGFTRILLREVAREHPEYGLNEHTIEIIASASSLHDIGKIAIPDAILNKPSRLTPEEFEIMKTHTLRGCEILMGLDRMGDPEYLSYAYNICRFHHERWSGKGYPEGLRENNIPIYAQVVAVADCFDALTTDRVYKRAIPQNKAYNMILQGECGAFSGDLLECFKSVQPEFFALSRKYADGLRTVDEEMEEQLRRPTHVYEETRTAQSQDKMLALLRHLDATVLELDRNAGTYHLLYQADHNFSVFRREKTVEDAEKVFVRTCVHPEDQTKAMEQMDGAYSRFFDEGSMEFSDLYRILDRDSGQYIWYRNTVLRLGSEDPRHCRALAVWRREPGAPEPRLSVQRDMCASCHQFPAAVLRRRNDRRLTITNMNRGFLNLVGYTEEELATRFHNHMAALLDPVDRDRVLTQSGRQMAVGRELHLEYRLITGDGHTVWILENSILCREAGGEYFQCVLTDVTAQKRVQEELRQSLERYRVAVQQEGDMVFEWNVSSDRFWVSGNWELKFGYQPQSYLSKALKSSAHVYPMDVKSILRTLRAIHDGALREETEFRLITVDGQYRWQRAKMTSQLGSDGKPNRVIGVITDIEMEKRALEDLTDKAQRDSLTGLYHKAAAQERIDFYLNRMGKNEVSVMLLVDVDNFRCVNDQYGHMFGDAVLAELSGIIGKVFRNSDVMARVGGDVFLLFMPAVSSVSAAVSRVCQLMEACKSIMQGSGRAITCSVGAALAPRYGRDFEILLQHCSHALCQAKDMGRDRYVLFSETKSLTERVDSKDRRQMKIDLEADFQMDLSYIISEALREYYTSGDLEKIIDSALEKMGRLFHVSRAYIVGNFADEYCRSTFEWCGDDMIPRWTAWHNGYSLELAVNYYENFDRQGIFLCQDVETLTPVQRKLMEEQNTLSMLQCAVMDNGQFVGFLGFDDCEIHRLWTKTQVDAISFAARIIFMLLMEERKTGKKLEKSIGN
jgi:putative two-component system response regulator